jgi:hypothetical protein
MIGQYLPNNNETATVAFRQKFCQTKQPLGWKQSSGPVAVMFDWCSKKQACRTFLTSHWTVCRSLSSRALSVSPGSQRCTCGACTHTSRSKLIQPSTSRFAVAAFVGRWESEPGMNHPFPRILSGPSAGPGHNYLGVDVHGRRHDWPYLWTSIQIQIRPWSGDSFFFSPGGAYLWSASETCRCRLVTGIDKGRTAMRRLVYFTAVKLSNWAQARRRRRAAASFIQEEACGEQLLTRSVVRGNGNACQAS